MFFFIVLLTFLFLWAFANFKLSGPDLTAFDGAVGENFAAHADDAEKTAAFLAVLKEVRERALATKSPTKGLGVAREFADNLSAGLETDGEFRPATANGVACEWAIAPGVDPKRRILFLHGGAFVLGSPKGHRFFADKLSHLANAAVLSVDYRMLPENKRQLATQDAQNAYHWILSHGPDGATPLDFLMVAGDSAGGNLALMVSGWSKTGAARKPDGVIGFSPSTDTTLAAPTFVSNRDTDPLLGEVLGFLHKVPKILSRWLGLLAMRADPSSPLVSPLFGDLNDLPPTLIHASSSEVLLGDSVRYTNKAKAAGSDVSLQIWADQIHDWHLFTPDSGSGIEAWNEIAKFIERCEGEENTPKLAAAS
ncbi:MAG: alpha/beta hydrolase [Pseudomonadota bacterium]